MKEFNIATYSRTLFGMLGGESTRVTLQCHNSMAGVIIDRFGKDTVMLRHDDEHFIAYVEVVPSDQFIGWIIGLSSYVQIMEPSSVVKQIKDLLSKQMELYR